MTIDHEQLRELAADPEKSPEDISQELGLGKAHNLYYELQKDKQAKEIYTAGRREVEASRKAPGPKAKPKAKPRSTPPPQWECQRRREQGVAAQNHFGI